MPDVLFVNEKNAEEKKKILQDEFDIAMTEIMEREVLGMCNLNKGVYESGWNEAWNKAWGEAQVNAKLQDIKNLIQKLGLSVEEL